MTMRNNYVVPTCSNLTVTQCVQCDGCGYVQDSTPRDGGRSRTRTSLTTARWRNSERQFRVTSPPTLFRAVCPRLRASRARWATQSWPWVTFLGSRPDPTRLHADAKRYAACMPVYWL